MTDVLDWLEGLDREITPGEWHHESGVGDYHILYTEHPDHDGEGVTLAIVGDVPDSNADVLPSKEYRANVNAICSFHRLWPPAMKVIRAVGRTIEDPDEAFDIFEDAIMPSYRAFLTEAAKLKEGE